MKRVEERTLLFLEDVTTDGSDRSNMSHFIDELNIKDDKIKLKEFLRILSNISNNHHRFKNFFNKVEQIITFYLEDIKKYFSDIEIFRIFCKNKKILLFLFESKIIIPNKQMFCFFDNDQDLYNNNNLQYFYIEFKSFIEEKLVLQKKCRDFMLKINCVKPYNYAGEEIAKDLELFKEKRRIGENDNHICELIRNDLINDFILYINQYKDSYLIDHQIKTSIYETNRFLIKMKSYSIIEYAVFHGSIQIFKYLLKSNVKLNPSLWIYAIHGQNYEIIHLLEENKVKFDEWVIKETIKCHCNDIMNYIINQYEEKINFSIMKKSIKNYNYVSLVDKVDELLMNIKNNIFDLCKYDYIHIFNILIKDKDIDINKRKCIKMKFGEESDDYDEYDIDGFDSFDSVDLEVDDYCITQKDITLLYIAFENENVEIIQILLAEPDIDINFYYTTKMNSRDVKYKCKQTILHAAVEKDNFDIVKYLISNNKIDINIKEISNKSIYKNEETALTIAIQNNNSEIVDLLLQHPKIDVHSKLYNILKCNDDYIYDYDYDEFREMEEIPILFLAVQQKNPKIVKSLLSKTNINVNSKYINITYERDDNNDFSIEQKRYERTALHEAIKEENIEIIKLLLTKNDIDVNCMAYFKNEMISPKLVKNLDDVEYNKTPLYMAVETQCPEIVELLLSNDKIEPNAFSLNKCILKDEEEDDDDNESVKIATFDFTAVHLAVFLGDLAIIAILMANKSININIENENGKKPIYFTDDEKIKELFANYNH